jgi:hypothetical protein
MFLPLPPNVRLDGAGRRRSMQITRQAARFGPAHATAGMSWLNWNRWRQSPNLSPGSWMRATTVYYRRWLRTRGVTYGAIPAQG